MSILKNATELVAARNTNGVTVSEKGRVTITSGFQKAHNLGKMKYYTIHLLAGKKSVALALSEEAVTGSKTLSRMEKAGPTAYAEIGTVLERAGVGFGAGPVEAEYVKAEQCIVIKLRWK